MNQFRLTRSIASAGVLLALGLSGCWKTSPTTTSAGSSQGQVTASKTLEASSTGPGGTVSFEINDGEKVVKFEIEEVREGTTLETVMRRIDQLPVSIRDSGATAFVDKIGDVETGSSEGWTYRIDGEFATRGIGETKLSPPTTIQWSYGVMPSQ